MRSKIVLFISCFLFTTSIMLISCSSDDDNNSYNGNQIVLHVEDENGELFQDGDIIVFNEVGGTNGRPGEGAGRLNYFMKNVSNQDINVKLEVVDIRGTDGSLFTFCVQPICVFDIEVGDIYPSNGTIIAPNQYNSQDDYFINNDPGTDDTNSIEYDIRFFVEDANGNRSNEMTITYKYMPN